MTLKWIVTAVDYDDSCDGKARVLGAFDDEAAAREYVRNDITEFIDQETSDSGECPFVADFEKMRVFGRYDPDFGCEWNVEGITV